MTSDDEWGGAPPPFKPDAALQTLKRFVRDQRLLVERGDGFSLKGLSVLSLTADDQAITARLARRPAQSPEWETKLCKSSADVRSLQDEIKRRLARWTDEPL